jgi:eukaryotic-like serine/threonine-protein kinase
MPEDPAVPPLSEQPTLDQTAPSSASSFGRYRLLQRLGEGGMGEVWLAEQTEPVRRQVALKVIKAGMDSAQVVARFEAERQALALMDHPAIATVFDGGTTPQGRPYFAMEYVKGEPITVYCDRHLLSTRERLELFMQVCEGVQHAHQKGIIHRDLKPSNVLVSIQDDRPVPKIIDFGVAKATTQHLTERSLFTELGVLIGTPEYMSPEQAEMGGLDIDSRTDIYALGVLLYELLTGVLPFDRKDLRQAGIAEIQRIIREKEPPRPSTRITQLGPASTEAAKNRHTEPRRLASELRGDLDWITMRALEKDRTRRYQTANALAMDVRRHLANEPVLAGPPGAPYRAAKFVRRHRVGVTAAVLLVALLGTFAVAMAVQAQRIARERNRANQEASAARRVSAFLVSLFEASKPGTRSPEAVTARDLLDAGAGRIDGELPDQPLVRAALHMTMGDAYDSLGLRTQAASEREQALVLRREVLGLRHPDAAASLSAHAVGRKTPAESEGLLREALALQRTLGGVDVDDLTRTLIRLAGALTLQGKYDEAESAAKEAVQTARLAPQKPNARLVVESWSQLGGVLFSKGQPDKAEEAWQSALDASEATLGPRHYLALAMRENVASAQLLQGQYTKAEESYREILRLQTPLGPNHPDRGITVGNIGAALYYQKKYGEAATYYREALDIARQAYGSDHEEVGICLANLGQALDTMGKSTEAVETLTQAVAITRRALGNDSLSLAVDLSFLATALRHSNSLEEAEQAAREALAINTRHRGLSHPRTGEAQGSLGRILAEQHRWGEAEPLLLAYAASLESKRSREGDLREVTEEMVKTYEALGKPEKAREWRAKLEVANPATGQARK